jgi:hypothetical protein
MADYLQTYADHFAFPIQMDTGVVGMEKYGETFIHQTTQGTFQAVTVIVATGPFHHPRIPAFASALSPQVEQLHSVSYHNPSQIPAGPVLVVGAGDSGAHIAAELAHSHPVADGSQAQMCTVIWATGYCQDFSWIRIPGVLDECGQPREHQGVSSIGGLFFLGFPWRPSRGSALVGWVGKDAKRLVAMLRPTVHVTGLEVSLRLTHFHGAPEYED